MPILNSRESVSSALATLQTFRCTTRSTATAKPIPGADGLQLVPLPLLLPPGRSPSLLRIAEAGAASDSHAAQLRVLRLGEPALCCPAPDLDAHRLHRRPRDWAGARAARAIRNPHVAFQACAHR